MRRVAITWSLPTEASLKLAAMRMVAESLKRPEAVQPILAAEGGQWLVRFMGKKNGRVSSASKAMTSENTVRPLSRRSKSRFENGWTPSNLASDPPFQAIQYCENLWDALFRFVDHPKLPIDNSATEREFQNVAKLRLNILFAGSTEGTHRATVLLGIATTCCQLGVDPQGHMCWAFQRLGKSLLPPTRQASQPELHSSQSFSYS